MEGCIYFILLKITSVWSTW